MLSIEGFSVTRYQSVDALQTMLAQTVFKETTSAKKAAGRALGTLVELVTFYMLRDWELESGLAIERRLPEYGNAEISHNVEFTLHPSSSSRSVDILDRDKTLTARQIRLACEKKGLYLNGVDIRPTASLLRSDILRHAAVFGEEENAFWTAHMTGGDDHFRVTRLLDRPYAMFECKRVGVEDGMKKGPQTIEKAKQGAYVARTVSGLQRVPRSDGTVAAIVEDSDGSLVMHDDYYGFLRGAIDEGDTTKLANIVLTVGVVSNHGNWFTAEEHNKEMKVLAQSYDWLLFLTDAGLAEFIEDVLWGDQSSLAATRDAFAASFGRSSGSTSFTKVTISEEADRELTEFFREEQPWDRWFNVIAPAPSSALKSPGRKSSDSELDSVPPGESAPSVSLIELKNDLHRLRAVHNQVGSKR